VADEVFIPFTVGGGLRSLEDIRAVLRSGADKVSLNTAAIEQPELISEAAETFGSQCMVVAVDARRRIRSDPSEGWEVYTHGGRCRVGLDAVEWINRAEKLGAGEILLTSMDCDGTRDGYDIELTRTISDSVRIPVIASGGAGTPEHFYDALVEGGASAVLAASLFHFGDYKIADVKAYLRQRGVPVR
jgi:cyclase